MSYSAVLRMSNAAEDFEITKHVTLVNAPRQGMRLYGFFGEAALLVSSAHLNGDGVYDVEVAVSVMDLFSVSEVEHFATLSTWAIYRDTMEFGEQTFVDA